jgi:hypothetical protein
MDKKNLIICFSSIKPEGFKKEQVQEREKNYDLALDFLIKSLPKNWDIIYNDNTLDSIDDIQNENLKSKLSSIKLVLHKNNEGNNNKGAGEHDMCKKCFLNHVENKYNWIVYFTARHIIPNSWYFNMLDSEWSNFDCVMSNPPFYYLNFKKVDASKNLYNDMLFAMKHDLFDSFVDSIDIIKLKNFHMNSENHLFDFVNSNKKINIKEIDSLGILRNDFRSFGWHLV